MKRRKGGNSEKDETRAGRRPAPAMDPEEVTEPGPARDRPETPPGAAAPEPEPPAETMDTLRAKVAALEDRVLRAKADYQNLQRRAAKEYAEAVQYANAELMRSVLAVADDFERSLAATEHAEDVGAVVDGVRLVYENFMKALREHGLEVIEAQGRPFDPHVHEAMMRQPSKDHPPGTVIEELAKGYRLRDRVLRPAKVVVSAEPDDNKEPGEQGRDNTRGD